MVFSLAVLIVYRGVFNNRSYQLEDDEAIIAFFQSAWSGFDGSQQACDTLSGKILVHSAFWQMDFAGIPGLVDTVASYISDIYRLGLPNRIAGPNLN